MQQIAHDNHFVPQLYLKQWSEDGIHLWSYRILVSHENVKEWEYRPIRGVAYQRDLYTSFVDGEEVDNFEKWLEVEFEKPVQESIKKVLKDNSLSAVDWERLASFLGAQDVRTPSSYLESMERWEKTIPNQMYETLEKSVRKLEEIKSRGETIQQSSQSDNPLFRNTLKIQIHPSSEPDKEQGYIKAEVVLGRAFWLECQNLFLTKTVKALKAHKWSIVRPAKGFQWFTCDHPVVKLNYYRDGNYDLKGGWGKRGGNIFMPISPRHLLFTEIGAEFPDQFTLTTEKTKEIQNFIAERSFRWIYAREPLKIISKLQPRHVDSEAYNHEKELWEKWHEQQSQAENKLTAPPLKLDMG